VLALLARLGYGLVRFSRWFKGRVRTGKRRSDRRREKLLPQQLAQREDPLHAVRSQSYMHRGGAYLGFYTDPQASTTYWIAAEPEHAVLVLGPPRSGKTSGIVIPAIIAHPGAAISTSTKGDVFKATRDARSDHGRLWWFDPSGDSMAPEGCTALSWSPVTAAATWDGALLMAVAMATASPQAEGVTLSV